MSKDREFVATVTRKGQVTIPAEVREQLGLSPHDKVVFRLSKGNKVEIEPLPMTLEEVYGSVPPINQPEDFDEIKRIAKEERAERWLEKDKR